MRDSRLTSFYKALSWRVFGSLFTMIITFIITHQWRFSLYIGTLEFISKISLFYFHERTWNAFLRFRNPNTEGVSLITDKTKACS